MDENNVTVTTSGATVDVTEQTEPVKTEPVKADAAKDDKATSAEVEKLKRLLSKANSEANSYKEQLRAKQSEAERAEADRLEQERALREELESLRKEKAVTDYTNRAMEVGFDADIAAKTANAMADGDIPAVFDALKAFVEATTKRIQNEALNRQPGLSTGTPPTTNNTVDPEMEKIRQWMGVPTHR